MAERPNTILAGVEEFPLRLNAHSSDVSLSIFMFVCVYVSEGFGDEDVFWW